MKIFQINSVCGYGSTGKICTALAAKIEKDGGESLIAYGRGVAPENISAVKINTEWGVRFHGALSRITDRQGFYSKAATKKLIAKIKSFSPDVVHLHNLHGYYLDIDLLLSYLAESTIPCVITLHDCWCFTGHCSHFVFAGCDKWKDGCGNCVQKGEYPKSMFADRSKRNCEQKKKLFSAFNNLTVVTPSRFLGGLAGQSFLAKHPIKVIENGIDTTVFTPEGADKNAVFEKYSLDKNKKLALAVSSVWTKQKGFADLGEIAARLGDGWQLCAVGVQSGQTVSGVTCLEKTDSTAELAALYRAADVFVNPTYEDTYPTVNVEAAACGTPTATYDGSGSAESAVAFGGIAVKQGDKKALTAAVQSLCGKKTAVDTDRITADAMTEKYLDLYKSIL